MESVVLVIHLILAMAIIALVLIQKSEGGGLGIGGGTGGLTTAQGAKNALTKATTICALCFFGTSLVLGVLAGTHSKQSSILDSLSQTPAPLVGEGTTSEDVKDTAGKIDVEDVPSAPISE